MLKSLYYRLSIQEFIVVFGGKLKLCYKIQIYVSLLVCSFKECEMGQGSIFFIVLLIMKEIIVTPEFDIDSVPIIRAVADLVCDK